MDRVIYTAMSGANAAMYRQQLLSNNLANVNTNGFRAEMATFRHVPVRGEGASTRVHALEVTAGHLDLPGTVATTGRPLDVAAQGQAYFAIQGLDGVEAYTRAGNLQISQNGNLVGHAGLPMLDAGGAPITIPANAEVAIGSDGTISVKAAGENPQAVGRLKLVTPNAEARLQRGEDGLFRGADNQPLPADPTAQLTPGALEGSNVNPVEAMVNMISAARLFEAQMKMIKTAEQDDQTASKLLGMSA